MVSVWQNMYIYIVHTLCDIKYAYKLQLFEV